MNNHSTKTSLWAILAVLSLAALACNMPATTFGGSTPEPASPLLQPGQPSAGAQTITLSAIEVNSIISDVLANQPGLPVKSLEIVLDNGQLSASGQVQQGSLNLPVELTTSVGVDGAGGLTFLITDATLGPFPLPSEYRSQINALLNESLKQPIAEATNNIFIESVVIDDGVAVISGRPR